MTSRILLIIISASCLLIACEEQRTSHTSPYMSEEQPRFYRDGKLEHLKSDNKIVHRIALIGDAGNADREPGKSLMKSISRRLNTLDTPETLVFLGDNIYDEGFQGDTIDCSSKGPESQKLDAQLYVGKATLNPSYFVPGNHDWDYHDEPGKIILEKQKTYLERCSLRSHFEPSDESGPTLVSSISNELYTIIFLDSQAIMVSDETQRKRAYGLIKGIFELSPTEKPVILAAHHPIATYGPHGGCYQQDFSGYQIINFFRRNGISWGQDMNAKEYAMFIQDVTAVIPDEFKVIFAAGHDHSLQIISLDQGADYSIVSGAGSNISPACHGDNSLFSQETHGYIELSFREEGQVSAEIFSYRPANDQLAKVYSQRLF